MAYYEINFLLLIAVALGVTGIFNYLTTIFHYHGKFIRTAENSDIVNMKEKRKLNIIIFFIIFGALLLIKYFLL